MADKGSIHVETINSENHMILDCSNVDICGNLEVQGDASFNSNVDISGNFTCNDAYANNTLKIRTNHPSTDGTTTLPNNVYDLHNLPPSVLDVAGSVTIGTTVWPQYWAGSNREAGHGSIDGGAGWALQFTRPPGKDMNDVSFKIYGTQTHNYTTLQYDANFHNFRRLDGQDSATIYVAQLRASDQIRIRGTVVSASDDRLKHNETIIDNALQTVRKLSPQTYDMENSKGELDHRSGFIAQEVAQIPELAHAIHQNDVNDEDYDEAHDDDYMSLSYNCIFTYAVAAIKELDAIVQAQETENSLLKAENSLIKSKLNELLAEAGKSTI